MYYGIQQGCIMVSNGKHLIIFLYTKLLGEPLVSTSRLEPK